MYPLFCDACGDQAKAVYPCKFVYHDGLTIDINICPDCMKNGELQIDLPRKRLTSNILKRLKTHNSKALWRKRSGANTNQKV